MTATSDGFHFVQEVAPTLTTPGRFRGLKLGQINIKGVLILAAATNADPLWIGTCS